MIKGILFDLNGTLIDILTDEWTDHTYRVTSNYLGDRGIKIDSDALRDLFFSEMKQQRILSKEEFPEFDVIALFQKIITTFNQWEQKNLLPEKIQLCAIDSAQVFRAASRYRLKLYHDVINILDELKLNFRMAAVSDGQALWAIPELQNVGLTAYFEKVIISSDYGFRKPDVRMFEMGLSSLQMSPEEVIFVGNDMYRDIYGAKKVGMPTIFFKSNQGCQEVHELEPDYIIYQFKELLNAVSFLQQKGQIK